MARPMGVFTIKVKVVAILISPIIKCLRDIFFFGCLYCFISPINILVLCVFKRSTVSKGIFFSYFNISLRFLSIYHVSFKYVLNFFRPRERRILMVFVETSSC